MNERFVQLDYKKTKGYVAKKTKLAHKDWFEDVFHEAYIKCLTQKDKPEYNPVTMILRMFKYSIRDYLGRQKVRPTSTVNVDDFLLSERNFTVNEDDLNQVNERLSYDMEQPLHTIATKTKERLNLSEEETDLLLTPMLGFTLKETALSHGMTPQWACVRKQRLVERLERLL